MDNLSNEVIEVIKYATKMEIEGRSFYEHAAEKTNNKHGKKLFQKLAQDEINHINTFEKVFTSVLGDEQWREYIDKEETSKTTVLNKLKERIEKQAHQQRAGDQEALRIGMELERESINLYKKWATESGDENVQAIFDKIIKEEEYHYDILQAEFDSLNKSGFWFDMAEFKMDGKF